MSGMCFFFKVFKTINLATLQAKRKKEQLIEVNVKLNVTETLGNLWDCTQFAYLYGISIYQKKNEEC